MTAGRSAAHLPSLASDHRRSQALGESLVLCRRAGLEHQAGETLLGLAAVQGWRGDSVSAARLAGAAEATLSPPIVDEEARIWARVRAHFIDPCQLAVGHAIWQRATHEGASMPVLIPRQIARRYLRNGGTRVSPSIRGRRHHSDPGQACQHGAEERREDDDEPFQVRERASSELELLGELLA